MSQFVMLCLECPSGGYVGVDKHSGGYPHITLQPLQAKAFPSVEEAVRYRAMFKKQDAWEIRELLGLKLGGVK